MLKRFAATCDHLGDEQTRQDSIFFRHVAANGKARAFLAAKDDPALLYILADVFKAYRRLDQFAIVKLRHTIDKVRGGHTAGHTTLPSFQVAAAFDKVIDEHRNQLVGIDEFTAFIENAEPVCIAVGCEAELERVLLHHSFEFAELLVRGFGMMTTEVNVAGGVK